MSLRPIGPADPAPVHEPGVADLLRQVLADTLDGEVVSIALVVVHADGTIVPMYEADRDQLGDLHVGLHDLARQIARDRVGS